jgi:hypothetical protein
MEVMLPLSAEGLVVCPEARVAPVGVTMVVGAPYPEERGTAPELRGVAVVLPIVFMGMPVVAVVEE